MAVNAERFTGLKQLHTAQMIMLLLALGLILRLINLEQRVFWVDEVLTALRIAGYTKAEVTQQLADGLPRLPADLLAYQLLNPSRGLSASMQALQQSPEHAPLYFLLLRFWAEQFGSSVLALRSFSVLCSLLLLGVVYRLSRNLFNAQAGLIGLGLMAVSPLFVAYAQEARPYSFWLLILALNSLFLLRALQQNCPRQWLLYALSLTLSLYSSLLMGLVLLGQIVYLTSLNLKQVQWQRFGLAVLGAGTAFCPWLWLIGQQWQTLQANTTWMRLPLDGFSKLIVWFYSVAILYFDVPVRPDIWWIAVAELSCAALVVTLISTAFLSSRSASIKFVSCLAFAVPLALIGLDLVSNGRYSTAPRYLLPFHLAVQLAVAGWLSQLQRRQQQGILAFLIAICLLSNLAYLNSSPPYLKSRSLHNPEIVTIVNQSIRPLLISESQNTIDMLSLSHLLKPETQIEILPTDALSAQLHATSLVSGFACAFIFNPSEPIQQAGQSRLTELYHPQLLHPSEFALTLWRFKC